MRLTLDLDPEVHRKIKTLAAFHGQTVKAFILARIGLDGPALARTSGSESSTSESSTSESSTSESPAADETEYLFSTPANALHLNKALKGKPEKRLKFDTLEDVKRALGIRAGGV